MFNFCIDCAYLSVNRVNGIGENTNFSSQLRVDFHCASPISYHVFISCGYAAYSLFVYIETDLSFILFKIPWGINSAHTIYINSYFHFGQNAF